MRSESRQVSNHLIGVDWSRMMLLALGCGVVFGGFYTVDANAEEVTDSSFKLQLEIGGGGKLEPSYEGSNSYLLSPYPIVRVKYFKLGALEIGGKKKEGFSLFPSFKIRAERSADDDASLAGTPTIPQSFELGIGIAYQQEGFKLFAQGRNGIIGHHSWTGEVGLDLYSEPVSGWTFSMGPRVSFADNRYHDTYFGVGTPTATLNSYDPDGGMKSYGLAASSRYEFAEQWAWETNVEYAKLTGDAAKSPLVQSTNQFEFRTGLSYTFGVGN